MSQERTLITGASSGIGLALAREFAKNGHPLVLTAPVEEELHLIAEELRRTHGTEVEIVAADLRDESSFERIRSIAIADGRQVEILVNNAGLGQRGKFWEVPLATDLSIVRVNVEAVIRLTKQFLPAMIKRRTGRVLNVASIAGFEPGPLLAVYHASKAFVLSFTEALATETEDTGVTVTALCPGATDTDFFPKADMEHTTIFQKGNIMAPQEVAAKGYEAVMKGERMYIPGGINKAIAFARRLLPESTQAHLNETMYEESSTKPEQRRQRGDVEDRERTH